MLKVLDIPEDVMVIPMLKKPVSIKLLYSKKFAFNNRKKKSLNS